MRAKAISRANVIKPSLQALARPKKNAECPQCEWEWQKMVKR
jgi:hypothetical protein